MAALSPGQLEQRTLQVCPGAHETAGCQVHQLTPSCPCDLHPGKDAGLSLSPSEGTTSPLEGPAAGRGAGTRQQDRLQNLQSRKPNETGIPRSKIMPNLKRTTAEPADPTQTPARGTAGEAGRPQTQTKKAPGEVPGAEGELNHTWKWTRFPTVAIGAPASEGLLPPTFIQGSTSYNLGPSPCPHASLVFAFPLH